MEGGRGGESNQPLPNITNPYQSKTCLDKAPRALKKFVVGGVVGGLFDYSVYSLPSFNQEWNQAMVGPC